ncbi:MAG: SDR family oxidoreductase [Actinomycetota bacterium]|nr:SDR family oxidoreductase [Actinomycetota bacterium]
MKRTEIAGKWALVTGAGSGMGKATATDLAREGANLILADISAEALGNAARQIESLGATVHTFCVDLTDFSQVSDMANVIHARWGAVDILVNCAGVGHMGHIVDTSLDDFRRLFDVNVFSIFHTVRAFAPEMMKRKSGNIVNISSAQAFFSVPTWGAYASSKFAVDGLSEALRYELFWHGISVSTVFPGVVKTAFYDSIAAGGIHVRLGLKLILGFAAKPEKLSRLIVRGIEKNKRIIMQPIVWPMYLLRRIFPLPFELAGKAGAWLLRKE